MFVIEQLKLNRYSAVAIPKVSTLYQRFGKTGLPSANAYTGDEVLPLSERKTDSIARAVEDYRQYEREEANRANE